MSDPIASKELRSAVWKAARERIYALAGDGKGNVRARPGKIWVRIPGVGLTEAWCTRFMPRHDQPVWLERRPEDGSFDVVDQWLSEASQPMPMILPHRSMHEEGGSDPIRVTPGMIQILRVYPTDPPSRAVFVSKGIIIRNDGVAVEAGGGMVPLRDFEDGETAWIVVRDGNTIATREIHPMDVVLAEVVVSDAVGPFSIRDRRQFIAPWIPKEELLSGGSLQGDVMGPLDDSRVAGLRGRPIADAVPNHNHALVWDSTQNAWKPSFVSISGDVSGDTSNSMVVGLRGRPIADVDPNNNDVLTWDAALGAWKPAPPPSGGSGGGGGGGGSGADPGPWVLRGLYNPQFPNTSMFPVRVGFTNETFQDRSDGRGITFARLSNADGNGWIWRLKSTPSLPVRIVCGFSDLALSRGDRDAAVVLYHSSNGRAIVFGVHRRGIGATRWNSYSSWNSTMLDELDSRHRIVLFGFNITSSGYEMLYFHDYDLFVVVFSEGWSFFGGPPTHMGIGVAHWGEAGAGWFWHWEEIPL